MLGSVLRRSCLVLPLLVLVATDCKPPRAHRSRAKSGTSGTSAKPVQSTANDQTPAPPPAQVASGKTVPGKARSALERRAACEFKKGAMAEQTLAPDEPVGQRIPIDHFVIVMQGKSLVRSLFSGIAEVRAAGCRCHSQGLFQSQPGSAREARRAAVSRDFAVRQRHAPRLELRAQAIQRRQDGRLRRDQ